MTLDFNVVTYANFESSTHFIIGDYNAAIKAADECIKLCKDFSEKSREEGGSDLLKTRCKAQIEECDKIKEKAQARIDGVSLLLRKEEVEGAQAESKPKKSISSDFIEFNPKKEVAKATGKKSAEKKKEKLVCCVSYLLHIGLIAFHLSISVRCLFQIVMQA